MIKIAVIDDHELVLQGICTQLSQEEKFDIVGAFTEVEELKLCLLCKKVDVLIMDLMFFGEQVFLKKRQQNCLCFQGLLWGILW